MSREIPHVIVFRKYLLPYSETFIADQGFHLRRYRARYTGFFKNDTGLPLLSSSPSYILEDYAKSGNLQKIAYRLGMVNRKWMANTSAGDVRLVHAHFLKDGIDALMLKKKLDIPLITTLHGQDITKAEKKSLLKPTRRDFFNDVDKIIVVSDFIGDRAIENGCPEHKMTKHHIGIDLNRFRQDKQEADQPELLFVGRLVEKKGCIYLLEAMNLLKHKYPEMKLTIVGDGPQRDKLMQKTKDDRLNVEFVGRESAENIRSRLARSWIFVAPSVTARNGDAEGLGMVFLEAQALRTPVVSFNSGGVPEAVEDGKTGLLAEEKDVAGLADRIDYLIQYEMERRQFGERGRQRVEQYFDINKQCALLEQIYDQVS